MKNLDDKTNILLLLVLQQRVSFLKVWLIYGIAAIVFTIIASILNGTGSSHPSTLGTAVFSGLLGIGFNLFSIICVHIHIKEINEGVFIPWRDASKNFMQFF